MYIYMYVCICIFTCIYIGLLSKVAFVASSMMMVGEREVKSKVLFYRTITIGSYKRLQKVHIHTCIYILIIHMYKCIIKSL
jgi:hypothetical protein